METKTLGLIITWTVLGAVTASMDIIVSMGTGIYGLGLFTIPLGTGIVHIIFLNHFKGKRWMFTFAMAIASLILLPLPVAGPPFYALKVPSLILQAFLGDVLFNTVYPRTKRKFAWSVCFGGIHWFYTAFITTLKYIPMYSWTFLVTFGSFALPITTTLGVLSGIFGYVTYKKVEGVFQ